MYLFMHEWVNCKSVIFTVSVGIGVGIGGFDTADNMLMVFTMGPAKSRSYLQSLHAAVAIGFVLGIRLYILYIYLHTVFTCLFYLIFVF